VITATGILMATSPDLVALAYSYDYAGDTGSDSNWKVNVTATALIISADVCSHPFHSPLSWQKHIHCCTIYLFNNANVNSG
jgi:hypothetical protein